MMDAWEPLDDCTRCHSSITMAMTPTDGSTALQRLNQGSVIRSGAPTGSHMTDSSDGSKCPQLSPS